VCFERTGLEGRRTVWVSFGGTGYHEAGMGTGDLGAVWPNVGESTGECYVSLYANEGVHVDILRPGSGAKTYGACQRKAE
jgi:hypothetical protein